MTTPSETLIELITPLLIERKLFLPEDTKNYRMKLATGCMRPEDWLLATEKALDKEYTE